MLVSGYFTMMLWRRRGLKALLKQRVQRVLIPCVLGLMTVVPALHWAASWATQEASRQDARRRSEVGARSELVETVRQGDRAGLERLLAGGAASNQVDPEFGIPALGWAALYGDAQAARLLIDHGAAECRQLLARHSGEDEDLAANPGRQEWSLDGIRKSYAAFLSSDRFLIRWSPEREPFHLILSPVSLRNHGALYLAGTASERSAHPASSRQRARERDGTWDCRLRSARCPAKNSRPLNIGLASDSV